MRTSWIAALVLALGFGASDLFAQAYMKNLGTRGFEISTEMTPTYDGNYVTVGPVTRPRGMQPGLDIYLNKVDAAGTLIWSREIAQVGPQGLGRSFPLSVTEVRSSSGEPHGYAITGGTFNGPTEAPIFIVTTDLNGNPIDYNTYGGPLAAGTAPIQFGYGAQIIQTPQGELAVCGSVSLADRVGQVPFILVVRSDLSLRFLRLYHDARYYGDLFGYDVRGHFADIEAIGRTSSTDGVDQPEGYVVVGTTSRAKTWFSEIVVMRTDLNGNPVATGIHGPEQVPSRGTALTVTSSGNLEVAGLVTSLTGAAPSTLVLNLDSSNMLQLDIDEYYGFVTIGDIRELSNGDFVLSGKAAYDRDAALLRIRPDGSIVFGKGYGGARVEIFTDAHEMNGGDIFASGATTTWTHGPVDEYLVRTLFDGAVPGCEVYNLNLDHVDPGYRERYTQMVLHNLDLIVQNEKKKIPPKTVVKLICPTLIIVHPWPWDWFVRADFNRDLVVDMSDAIGTLGNLFAGREASVPVEASDSNSDGTVDLSDPIHTLNYLFNGGSEPSAPFTKVGPDPSNTESGIFTMEELQQAVSNQVPNADDLTAAPMDLLKVQFPWVETKSLGCEGDGYETHEVFIDVSNEWNAYVASALVQQPGVSLATLRDGFVASYAPNHIPQAAWLAPDPYCVLWTTPQPQVNGTTVTFTASNTNPAVVRYRGCVLPSLEADEDFDDM